MKEKKTLGNLVPAIVFISFWVICIVMTILNILGVGEWIPYWIYYKPFYTLFENSSIYLPFYLHCAGILLIICIPSLLLLKFLTFDKVRYKIIFVLIVSLIIITIASQNIYKEVILIIDGKYEVIECNLDSLRMQGGSKTRSVSYRIISNEMNDEGKYVSIQMDFYQYNELLKIKEENKIITVYYFPNTGRMLKYE